MSSDIEIANMSNDPAVAGQLLGNDDEYMRHVLARSNSYLVNSCVVCRRENNDYIRLYEDLHGKECKGRLVERGVM